MTSPIARKLIRWYKSAARDLPWRRTRDPWHILVSEVMLQQTRVETVLPYYDRFLARYPTAQAFAAAPESDILAMWAGLGYYSRVRNLHAAARTIASDRRFPSTYSAIRALPGVGDYTAAAVASLCLDLPHAVVDGNVLRVAARLTNDPSDIGSAATRKKFTELTNRWLDRKQPALFNQAIMELGATVCVPRNPRCEECPVATECEGRRNGNVRDLPVKLRKEVPSKQAVTLFVIERAGTLLLWQRDAGSRRMKGFWELPGPAETPDATRVAILGKFSHTITNHHYEVTVERAKLSRKPPGCDWIDVNRMSDLPVSTMARKALDFHL